MTSQGWQPDPYNWDMDLREPACPSDEDLAAYIDNGLDAATRAGIQAHAVVCDDCRALLSTSVDEGAYAGASLAARPPGRTHHSGRGSRGPWVVAGGLGIVAAAAMLLLIRVPEKPEFALEPAVRATGGSGAVARLTGRIPSPDAQVAPDALLFQWEPAASPHAVYVLTVSDGRGDVIWNVRTSETMWAPPADSTDLLPRAVPLYWRVEVLLPDLSSEATDLRRFQLRVE